MQHLQQTHIKEQHIFVKKFHPVTESNNCPIDLKKRQKYSYVL